MKHRSLSICGWLSWALVMPTALVGDSLADMATAGVCCESCSNAVGQATGTVNTSYALNLSDYTTKNACFAAADTLLGSPCSYFALVTVTPVPGVPAYVPDYFTGGTVNGVYWDPGVSTCSDGP
jgi:hypothetical protein